VCFENPSAAARQAHVTVGIRPLPRSRLVQRATCAEL
jgi:hypothetical protein